MYVVFFFNDTATTEIYTLSLHDALPICMGLALVRPLDQLVGRRGIHHPSQTGNRHHPAGTPPSSGSGQRPGEDRKSTRLNSSHANISYAVFCLKKKKNNTIKSILNKNIT